MFATTRSVLSAYKTGRLQKLDKKDEGIIMRVTVGKPKLKNEE